MVKETPSLGRILAMVVFTMSCVGILLFLWLAFGGSIPLRPEAYRMQVSFPEAATLTAEADVRLAGVNVGKVKTKKLEKEAARTLVELELKEQYAPVPSDTRAILRQKTLLGETYVELSTGDAKGPPLKDGGRLADVYVEPTVELDEIFNAFDRPTRTAFQEWVSELSKAIEGGRGQDLNDAFGNIEGFAVDGATLLEELNEQETAVRRLVRNTGRVFGAINQREGALRQLIVNSSNTFEATASRDEALADTFQVFPTFLDESKATLSRLQTFATDTRPLVNALKPSADDLGPTVRDLGDLAPDLEGLFRDLDPLIKVGDRSLPGPGEDAGRGGARLRGTERVPRRAEPDPQLRELLPGPDRRLHHQRRVGHLGRAGRRAHAGQHRPDRTALVQPLRDPPGLRSWQLLPAAQRPEPGARARRLREHRLQPGRRRAEEPERRAGRDAGHQERRQAACLLRGSEVAL